MCVGVFCYTVPLSSLLRSTAGTTTTTRANRTKRRPALTHHPQDKMIGGIVSRTTLFHLATHSLSTDNKHWRRRWRCNIPCRRHRRRRRSATSAIIPGIIIMATLWMTRAKDVVEGERRGLAYLLHLVFTRNLIGISVSPLSPTCWQHIPRETSRNSDSNPILCSVRMWSTYVLRGCALVTLLRWWCY